MVDASIVNLTELGVLVVGVVLALQQLREIKETRQAELFSVIMDRMDTVEFWQHYYNIRDLETYEDLQQMVQDDPSVYGGLMSIVMLVNHIGWLVKNGLIKLEVVSETISIVVIRVYENTMPIFDEYGKRTGRIQRYSNLEYLYNAIRDKRPDLI